MEKTKLQRSKLALLPTGAIALVLALAAIAYACTTVGGTANITAVTRPAGLANPCGSGSTDCAVAGDTLTVGTTGSPYRLDGQGNVIQYYLYMLNYEAMDDGMACMIDDYPAESGSSEPMLIGGPTSVSSSTGQMTPTTGMVPVAAPTDATQSSLGKALVCFMGAGAPGGNAVNEAVKAVTTRVARMWGTAPDSLRIVAI